MARTTSTFNRQALAARVVDERGQTMAEYALIISAISLTVVAAVLLFGTNIGTHITNIANLLP